MASSTLAPEARFQIDFNLQMMPAAQGIAVPSAAASAMLGVGEAQYIAYVDEAEQRCRVTAERLLAESAVAAAFDRWPVTDGSRILFVGDSITTYRYSYARLIEAMAMQRRPADRLTFANVAQSGYTSTHALEATYTQFLAQQPDWVFVKLGVNDSKQFGDVQGRTLVPGEVYRANMAAIVDAFRRFTSARLVLITPTPVVEAVVNTLPEFAAMRMTWDNRNLQACAQAVAELAARYGLALVDLYGMFGMSPNPALYLPDGLHPSPAGHERIVYHVLQGLR